MRDYNKVLLLFHLSLGVPVVDDVEETMSSQSRS